MKCIAAWILCLCYLPLLAQKPSISNTSYKSWELLFNYNITDDGKYVWYTYGSEVTGSTLVVRAINGDDKKIFTGVREAAFAPDNKHLIFISEKGLGILSLGGSEVEYLPGVNNFILPEEGNGEWLKAQYGDTLLVRNLRSGRQAYYPDALPGYFNRQGTVLVLHIRDCLIWMDLQNKQQRQIATKKNIGNITFDHTGTRLVFTSGDAAAAEVHYYSKDMDSARVLVSPRKRDFPPTNGMLQFSQDDRLLFFKVARKKEATAQDSTIITDKLRLWDYRDARLRSQQAPDPYGPFSAVVPVSGGNVIQLENIDSSICGIPGKRFAIVCNVTNEEDAYWNPRQIPGHDLISLSDGSRRNITRSPQQAFQICLSPAERFVTWFDTQSKHYFSYEISTGITRDISAGILNSLVDTHISRKEVLPYGMAGWLANDTRVLVYDEFDIWQLDPAGKLPPLNITNEYGRQQKTTMRIVYSQELPTLKLNTPLLITCLDSTRFNGFTYIKAGANAVISPPAMEPCVYHFPALAVHEPPPPVKAQKADVYLLQHQSATQAPNLVTTTDFRHFRRLSDIQPQQGFNWLQASLVRWSITDSLTGTGILYKPEDFDSTKKYPVIFHYYEEKSKGLFLFPSVGLSTGDLNISWYVSNGYLVFIPDIYRPTGQSGAAILNTVVSAAKYLSSLPYVNGQKMGLQGHSFGGYETNYLITHTNLFAAAQASAAPADLFGLHGGTGFGGRSYHYISEVGQLNQGATPWEDPQAYLQGSPVLSVSQVTTPLLLMHNKEDGAVPFSQSVALFTALRRLGKPVWLLEYEGEGHVLFDPGCLLDFNMKQQEFFDYYLKDKAFPTWMRR
ncbi:alpha/beta hydrolase family protein [Chitinophaga filiformis]|uniref:Prolyl oligopeptidase family serine peptidase n=1 Tax=Chitinophaga filiformis TaxID=104663 RepID=A0ABY4I4M6_CHIFI|nr:prolyl oligopeptidase family serine peptidase [Chitinophaga filiformis]UPK69691.1 prolyl oligopeptidase family serine peptidase [Chitinophaga filiformis]